MADPATTFDAAYYQTVYRDYDLQNPPSKMAYYRRTVENRLGQAGAARILDIGCAFGHFLAALPPAWRAHGTDASRHAIERAKQRLPGAALAVARRSEIPFDVRFTAVTAWDVIEHIPDLDVLAREIAGHLAVDGRFVFVVPVYDGPLGPIVKALDRDPTHIHQRSRSFWLDWASEHFALEDWWGIFRYLLPGGHYLHRPTRALRAMAPAILVVTRRK